MDDKKTFRTFFAIALPEETLQQLSLCIDKLKKDKKFSGIRWIPIENLHITLRFLGNITEEQSSFLIEKARQGLQSVNHFSIELKTIISFPPDGEPRILAIKPKPITSLAALALLLDEYVIELGLPEEKRTYTPHLTIGKKKEKHDFLKLEKEIKITPLKFKITDVKLLRSHQTKAGSIYSEVATIPLKG